MGLGVYGILSAPGEHTVIAPRLRPVLSLKARVASIRFVPAGEGMGYGLMDASDRDRTLVLLPIGYGDGFPRALSNGAGYALIRGMRAPVVGLVCMDMTVVDVTEIPGVAAGDTATLIGRDGENEIGAETLAALVRSSMRVSTSGRERKYYSLTNKGNARLRDKREEWETFSGAVDAVVRGIG